MRPAAAPGPREMLRQKPAIFFFAANHRHYQRPDSEIRRSRYRVQSECRNRKDAGNLLISSVVLVFALAYGIDIGPLANPKTTTLALTGFATNPCLYGATRGVKIARHDERRSKTPHPAGGGCARYP